MKEKHIHTYIRNCVKSFRAERKNDSNCRRREVEKYIRAVHALISTHNVSHFGRTVVAQTIA